MLRTAVVLLICLAVAGVVAAINAERDPPATALIAIAASAFSLFVQPIGLLVIALTCVTFYQLPRSSGFAQRYARIVVLVLINSLLLWQVITVALSIASWK